MTQEHAEKVLAFIESQCKAKVEKAIKETLGVNTNLFFTARKGYGGYYVTGADFMKEVQELMTSTPLLKQLFKEVALEVFVGEGDEEFIFRVAIRYDHAYEPGSNGRDLMKLFIMKDDGEVIIRK